MFFVILRLRDQTIGVLDLSGFENFECNSFEQLCINIVNEHLHQVFKKYLISVEEEAYADEGISWQSVQWDDDSELLQLCLQVKCSVTCVND